MKCSWQLLSLVVCGSVIVGCGDTADTTVSDTAPQASPTAAPATTAPTLPAKLDDPLLEGIEFDDPQEFPNALSAYEAKPTDPTVVQDYAEILLSMAWAHAQGDNPKLSDASLTRAGDVILKANEQGVKLPVAPESTLQAEILYGYACVLGKTQKNEQSLQVLGKAIEVGFSNVQLLKSDTDLNTVRELPAYETQLVTWEAHFEGLRKEREAAIVASAQEDLAKGETFPFDFELTDVHGKPLNLSQFTERGRVCVVDVWGTWCPPCRQEIPAFIKLQDKYKKYGLQVIGLNDERGVSDEANLTTVKNFMANTSMNYPCAMISKEVMEQLPDFKGFPTTLFIDHRGDVRVKAFGFHEHAYMETVVEALLREQAAEKRAATN